MKAIGRPIYHALRSRSYAAASQQTRQVSARPEVEVKKEANGLTLACQDTQSPLARLSVFVGSGSRDESTDQHGITHLLRHAASLTTMGVSKFGLIKRMQQKGATFTCSNTRENMIYSVECRREELDGIFTMVRDVVCMPEFFSWEIAELNKEIKNDLAVLEQNLPVRMVEALNKAAFRDGLGNSLFMAPYKVGTFSDQDAYDYYHKHYTHGNVTIVGLGMDMPYMEYQAKVFDFPNKEVRQTTPSSYQGGEIRIETSGNMSHAIVATEGVSMDSADAAALGVLQQVMGTGPHVKYSSDDASSRIGKAVAGTASNPVAAACIMSCYRDTGLFGFQVTAHANDADKVLRSVAATFGEATKGSITDADVERAKNQLRSAYLLYQEDGANVVEELGTELSLLGQASTEDSVLSAIDGVTTAQVNQIAKKVINGKPSMAAAGNLTNTPYMDKLF